MNTELFNGMYDAARWGVSDFYQDAEDKLKSALCAVGTFGTINSIDTGWYSVKKEIHSGRVFIDENRVLTAYASCSDDFDTVGNGEVEVNLNHIETSEWYDRVVAALDEAIELAETDRKENEVFEGFSIGPDKDGDISSWVYTIVLANANGDFYEEPPGDNYHQWGWQESPDEIPVKCQNALMQFAHNWTFNIDNTRGRIIKNGVVCGGWRIKPWDAE